MPRHTLCTDVNVDYLGLECFVQLFRLGHKSYFYSPVHLHPRIKNPVYHGVARHVLTICSTLRKIVLYRFVAANRLEFRPKEH